MCPTLWFPLCLAALAIEPLHFNNLVDPLVRFRHEETGAFGRPALLHVVGENYCQKALWMAPGAGRLGSSDAWPVGRLDLPEAGSASEPASVGLERGWDRRGRRGVATGALHQHARARGALRIPFAELSPPRASSGTAPRAAVSRPDPNCPMVPVEGVEPTTGGRPALCKRLPRRGRGMAASSTTGGIRGANCRGPAGL